MPESLASIWRRRAVSIPACLGLAVVCAVTAPLWICIVALLDAVNGQRGTWPRTRALCFFGVYLGCEVAGIALAGSLWLLTLGGRLIGARRYRDANETLQRAWTSALFGGAKWLFSIRVVIDGAECARRGPLLLFVRHASTADTVLTAALVANPHRLSLRYVLKRELLWDPCLDIVGRRLPNAFIGRSRQRARDEIAAIARLGADLDPTSAVLIYPEGTRFSADKLETSLSTLRARGDDELALIAAGFEHVLPPRTGGALALLAAAPNVDAVFVEHVGFEGAASLPSFWGGALIGKTIHVRLRRIPAATIPALDRDRWLFEQWREVDRWISEKNDLQTRAA